MKIRHRASLRVAGFTLIELLVVIALMSILLTLTLPSAFRTIQHQKILAFAQQTAILMRQARLEAIKTAGNTVVQIDAAAGSVTAYADLNNNQTLDANEPLLGKLELTKGVTLLPVSGFTSPPSPAVAIFRSNGGVAAVGAFRFQDTNGDQLEARVLTATSGRVQIRKLQDDGTWIANGEGGKAWTWK